MTRHYDRTGTHRNAVLQPLKARFTDSVSGQEPPVFTLDIDNSMIDTTNEFDIYKVMRRNQGLGIANFTRAFIASRRDVERA